MLENFAAFKLNTLVMSHTIVFQLSFILHKVDKITQNKVRKATFPASMEEV